jgi:release factor glutamine methyltransferase
MKTIGEILKLSQDFLADRKIDRPRRIAEEIIAHVLHLKKMDLYLQFDKPIIEHELGVIRELLKRCSKGEPLDYALGEVEFFGCRIRIDRRVLIPRPETEILVEKISKQAKTGILWDVCTGSGCIGIALKKACPELQVTLSDISNEALALASENAKSNGVDVSIARGDLLEPFKGQKADFVICNPPYISEDEYAKLDSSVRDYEPKLALVGGPKGSEFYEKLKGELPSYLNPGANVFFEIGAGQGEVLKGLFPEGELQTDWAGLPRFFTVRV